MILADETKTITWARNDAEPFYILEGSQKDKGFGDEIEALVKIELKNYKHKSIELPLKRVLAAYNKGENLCFSTWINNTTKNIVYTSLPYVSYYPLGFIVRKSDLNKYDQNSIVNNLNNPKHWFGYPAGRGYGNILDKILKEKDNKNYINQRFGKDSVGGIINLLIKKRIDYTYEYPFVFHYFQKKKEINSLIQFIPTKRKDDKGNLGSISCTKNLWGKEVVLDINKALNKIVKSEQFKKIINKWIAQDSKYWATKSTDFLTFYK